MRLARGGVELTLAPGCGGAMTAFRVDGTDILRATSANSNDPLRQSNFALVPFSNRIRDGRFAFDGRDVCLAPNFPDRASPHPLHGQGWLSPWQVIEAAADAATLSFDHPAGEWPWHYRASQTIELRDRGYRHALSLTNLDVRPMPCGLGFHPYFPRTPRTRIEAQFAGEWRNDADCLPLELVRSENPRDWWEGQPAASHPVDTVYTGRAGSLRIVQPDAALIVTIDPDAALAFAVVYVPEREDYLCIEPVTHATDAFNAADPAAAGLRTLAPGETWQVSMTLDVAALA